MDIALSYSFNLISPLIAYDAPVKSVKPTALVRNILWIVIFVWSHYQLLRPPIIVDVNKL